MYYTKGDTPAAPILVLPAVDGDPVDLTLYSTADAQLVLPSGAVLPATAELHTDEDDEDAPAIAVTLPELVEAGVVYVSIQLSNAQGRQDTFTAEPFVVQDPDGWHTLDSARAEVKWAKAIDSDVRLYILLRTAAEEVGDYADGYRGWHRGDRPGLSLREAQLLHARNRNASAHVDPASGDDGVDGYSIGPFPLDWTIKQIVRPKRRLPAIG